MTVGIYGLVFNGTDGIYVGQSSNIEYRFQQHKYCFASSHYNHKLRLAYQVYGEPTLEILEECSMEELDNLENFYIKEFDSVNSGMNIKDTAGVVSRGTNHHNSLYTKKELVDVLDLLIQEPLLPYKKISLISNVSVSTIENIARLTCHLWLKEEYPDKYNKLVSLKGNRPHTKITNYPAIIDPQGVSHYVDNAAQFAKIWGLNRSHLVSVLNGKRKSHRGWIKDGVL